MKPLTAPDPLPAHFLYHLFDALAQEDASFALMMLTMAEFIPALLEALGGEEVPQGV